MKSLPGSQRPVWVLCVHKQTATNKRCFSAKSTHSRRAGHSHSISRMGTLSPASLLTPPAWGGVRADRLRSQLPATCAWLCCSCLWAGLGDSKQGCTGSRHHQNMPPAGIRLHHQTASPSSYHCAPRSGTADRLQAAARSSVGFPPLQQKSLLIPAGMECCNRGTGRRRARVCKDWAQSAQHHSQLWKENPPITLEISPQNALCKKEVHSLSSPLHVLFAHEQSTVILLLSGLP